MRRYALVGLVLPALLGTRVAAGQAQYSAQVSAGEVSFRAEPAWGDTALVIQLSANTHSVDLSRIDLRRQARLRVGTAVLEPAVVGTFSGHHARATLVFRMPLRPSVAFTLELRDVPDSPLRTLTWGAAAAPATSAAGRR